MRTTDATARAIQRGNMIAMGLYAAGAAALAPRFQSWPRDLTAGAGSAPADSFFARTMLAHPAYVWMAIPLTLLVANGLSIVVGDRGNLFRSSTHASKTSPHIRGIRARAFAWLGCAMTTLTLFVSGVFYAGWDAVARRDPQVFWRGITTDAAVLTPMVFVFLGLAAWSAYRSFDVGRKTLAVE